jgi:hypothetical protein
MFWLWLFSDHDRVDFINHIPFLRAYLASVPIGSLALVYLVGRYQGRREIAHPTAAHRHVEVEDASSQKQ